jgi:Ca-activated chloride channel family protein
VLVALDVSLSMEASDVLPSRLQRSQAEIRELFDRLRGNRVGILLFAGSPFLLTPLTVDVAAANLFLDAVDVDVLPDPGTNLEEALRGALGALEDAGSESAGNLVVLFTDGEGHVGDVLEAARELAEAGIPVVTVGVGTPNGEPIPVLDAAGHLSGYKKDRSGNVVLSRLDEDTLREIASITGGTYFPATLQGREVADIEDLVARMERGELGGSIRRRVDERFQVPATVSAVFLFLAFLVPEARREDKEGKA